MDNIKKTGRLSTSDRSLKQQQAKQMYIKGFNMQSISETIGIGLKTLGLWKDECKWDAEKDLHNMRPSEIKNLIMEWVRDVKKHETPLYKADDLAKISAAFERLDDYRKKIVYTMEVLDEISNHMVLEAAKIQGKQREDLLELIKTIRFQFDKYVNHLLQNND